MSNFDEEKLDFTKEESYEILGLSPESSIDTVKQKYGALLRQYKRRTDEKGTTYEDLAYYRRITAAYDTILGIKHDYNDDNPTAIIPYKVRRKFGKFFATFEQYWFAFLLVGIVIILAVTFVIQRKRTGTHDMIIKYVGAFAQDPMVNMTEKLNEKSEVFDNAQVTFFTVTTKSTMLDASARSQASNFLAQLMSPGALDVIFTDKESFEVYAAEKAYTPLDDYCTELINERGTEINFLTYASEPGADVEIPSAVYGIEITDSEFFNDVGLSWLYDEAAGQEKSMIFSIASNTKNADNAWKFLEEIIK